jgi:hypothetical protein
MKIAVCLHGQPRLYEKGYENIKKFTELNNTHFFDFFFHTWYDEKLVGQYYECSPWRNILKNELEIKQNTIKDLLYLFKPKEFNYETPITFDLNPYVNTLMYSQSDNIHRKSLNNTISNIYSKYQVSKLLEEYVNKNNTHYDFIISIRFDFLNELNFLIEDMKENVINCMNVSPRLYISDFLIITNQELFFKYSNTYINLLLSMNSHLNKEYLDSVGCGFGMCPESIVTSNVNLYYKNLYNVIFLNNKIPYYF